MTISQSDIVGIDLLRQPTMRDFADGLKVRRVLPSTHHLMIGPYILFDHFGPALFDAGSGFDMGPHPHIGIAAVTYLFDGEIIHRDDLGEVQTIRPGEVNWMTAGSGIVHSERTSPEARARGSNLFGVQAWVALPSRHEEVAAHFAHYDAVEIPRICADGVEFTLVAGTSDGLVSPAKTYSDLVCAEIVLTGSARYQVKPGYRERAIYVVAGEIEVMGQLGTFGEGELIMLAPGAEIVLQAPAFHAARLMLIGGEPLSEPRYIHWNFVSSSAERIEQAKADWREGRFPDVPGEHGLMPLPQEEIRR
ncbi:pirin family protein [Mesorhizobium sp. BR1-1-12]|uniref:pirin family protein n=1 Tax=unclassified Mesorhizobium TaxID=325217 RepID=UPI001CCBF7DA|nr:MULTISPECIES: pirin family protein [unclassified Mesorhizobium]MBZ9919880.1 pirin family protein [Mesorhizobium sp. BR1-1-7]MBZ9972828.1 pirin family protein [Mesorhizobium sp. BR1-1-12]